MRGTDGTVMERRKFLTGVSALAAGAISTAGAMRRNAWGGESDAGVLSGASELAADMESAEAANSAEMASSEKIVDSGAAEKSVADVGKTECEMASLLDQVRCERGVRVTAPLGGDAGVLYPDPRYEATSRELLSNADGMGEQAGGDAATRETAAMGLTTAWRLCQWASRFTLAGAARQMSHDAFGPIARFSDPAKSMAFRLDDDRLNGRSGRSADDERNGGFDLRMELNGQIEYEHRMPRVGQAWPHLLLERNLLAKPVLSELNEVRLRIDFRIPIHQRAPELTGWDDGLHTAQFLAYLTIQNLGQNKKDGETGTIPRGKGYGDYLWFGVPMFDIRYRHAPRYVAMDFSTAEKAGTGKMIFLPGAAEYFDADPHMGEWVTINRDILPLLREALQAAWDGGYLADSHTPEDYHLSMMNLGWEITGPIHGAAEVRNLSLTYR